MSLDHILLGMLRQPATGYDLGREFAESAQHFWYADRSQIYPALKKLQAKGLLRAWEAPSERGPKRRVYETTPAGHAELRSWLNSGPKIGRDRLGYVAQTFFLGELGDFEESLRIVATMRAEWEQKLSYLEYAEREVTTEYGDWSHFDVDGFHHYAALRMGLHQYRSKLAWCDETSERLRSRIAAATATPALD